MHACCSVVASATTDRSFARIAVDGRRDDGRVLDICVGSVPDHHVGSPWCAIGAILPVGPGRAGRPWDAVGAVRAVRAVGSIDSR
jgi:hypothetical protein